MCKYRFNWEALEDYDTNGVLSRIETICDYVNAEPLPKIETVLTMLKINKVVEKDEQGTVG